MSLASGTLYNLAGLANSTSWLTAGFVTAAKTGIDYRKYKKGEITKD